MRNLNKKLANGLLELALGIMLFFSFALEVPVLGLKWLFRNIGPVLVFLVLIGAWGSIIGGVGYVVYLLLGKAGLLVIGSLIAIGVGFGGREFPEENIQEPYDGER